MEIDHSRFIRQALKLAARGQTSPNPKVGAVVVQDGKVLATGWHRAVGQPHGEVDALRKLDFHAPGATLYVNLEPCSHFGRTPPCTDAVIRSGIVAVVAGLQDPNPLVHGQGFERLRQAGIAVTTGVLEAECQWFNRGFVKVIQSGLPFVTLKMASSADGKTATHTGHSQWITSPAARTLVHRLRAESDAVLVGVGTVLADDPALTVRHVKLRSGWKQPTRVILDSHLRTPDQAQVLDAQAPTVIVTSEASPIDRRAALEAIGIGIEVVPLVNGRLCLDTALRRLVARGITYVLAEPGRTLAWSLAAAGLIDHYQFFMAPRLVGGDHAPGLLGGMGIDRLEDGPALRWGPVHRVGPDLLLEAFPLRDGDT